MSCLACDCCDFVLLGNLGTITWVRCRACGLDQTAAAEEVDQ